MEKQKRLIERFDSIEGIEPIVSTNKNVSMSAGAKVIEIVIKKTYVIPR